MMNIKIYPNLVLMTLENETLLEALVRHRLPVENLCNGQGTCGKCKVRISNCVSPPSEQDLEHLTASELQNGVRLACTVIPQEGMTVKLDFIESQDRKESVNLGLKLKNLNSGVAKIHIKPGVPSLDDERGDWDRLADELETVTGYAYKTPDLGILRKVPEVLRAADYDLTATVYQGEVLDIDAGDTTQRLYGISVDIGTTSVAVALVDLNSGRILKVLSSENGQIAYGADVISRLAFAGESRENAIALRTAVRETINHLLGELCRQLNIDKNELYKMTVVGNTTMQHLFAGFAVSHLAVSPFVSVCNRLLEFKAEDLEIEINPRAKLILLPDIGGFVGSDTLGAILGAPEVLGYGNHLLIDIGTNCELFLKTKNSMMACSTAAGPAFEGGGITCGMRAKPGAIESITISAGDGVACRVIGEQEAVGICGSGLIEGIDELRKAGVLTKQGKIVDPDTQTLPPELQKRIVAGEKGRKFILDNGTEQSATVFLSQKDISELQLAKGAVCAGIKTLLEMSGVRAQELDSIILSGTFASYIKPQNIIDIGLVPDVPVEKVTVAGNAAHVGALLALLDQDELENARKLYLRIKHVELGGSSRFSDYFMSSMYLEKLE